MSSLHKRIITLLSNNMAAFLGLGGLCLVAYANALNAPWYFDDFDNIVENIRLRDLSLNMSQFYRTRGIANLSFALNYHWGGVNVFGYHLVNLLIHWVTSGLVFLLLKRVFTETPLIPFLGAVLFALHPLQTQAVTYVVQRMTCLSGLFFFSAMELYCRFRTLKKNCTAYHVWLFIFYLGALVTGAAAVMTKENTAVLPVALLLFDLCFLPHNDNKSRWRSGFLVLPFMAVPLWVAWQSLMTPLMGGRSMQDIGNVQTLSTQKNITPINYLVTEFSVLWLYLRLMFVPLGQALDYAYPLTEKLVSVKNIVACAGLMALLCWAGWLFKRNRWMAFGILWFFLGLSVESTLIPLDPVFEHRLYIPMFGFVVFVLGGLLRAAPINRARWILLVIAGVLLTLTVQRNALWNDPVAFYRDNFNRVPHSERVVTSLSSALSKEKKFDESIEVLRKGIEVAPGYWQLYRNLAGDLLQLKKYDQAMTVLQQGLSVNPVAAELYIRLGILYDYLGQPQEALDVLHRALKTKKNLPKLYLTIGTVHAGQQEWQQAMEFYRKSLDLIDENSVAHDNLGIALYQTGDLLAARKEFQRAIELDNEYANALNNLATVEIELGNIDVARQLVTRLQRLDPALAQELRVELENAAR